jgi:hypothetical protein
MLETGITCVQCGVRQLKKFFTSGMMDVCCFCLEENSREYQQEQGIFQLRMERGDKEVKKCGCGSFFAVNQRRKDKCPLCQKRKDESEIATEKERGLELILSSAIEKEQEKEGLITQRKKESIMKEFTQEKLSENERKNIGEQMEIVIEDTKESITPVTVKNSAEVSSMLEDEETLLSDSIQSSVLLKEEICQSLEQLNDSSKQLISYAKKLSAPMMCSEQREVIMETSTRNITDALRCLEESRNTMKTKLEYLKFAKSFEPKERR